eukprot:1790660-Amphidinium_carterae.1
MTTYKVRVKATHIALSMQNPMKNMFWNLTDSCEQTQGPIHSVGLFLGLSKVSAENFHLKALRIDLHGSHPHVPSTTLLHD